MKIAIEKNIYRQTYSFIFILLTLLLIGIGFVVLYSGSTHYSQRFFNDSLYFLLRQSVNLLISLLGFFFFSLISLERLRKLLPLLLFSAFILCILTFVPGIGSTRNGASRWIRIFSLNFQPSEWVKLVLILFLANFFDKNSEYFDMPMRSIFPPFVVSGIFILLVFFQNDFSTAMFLLFIMMMMFFIAGASVWWFLKGVFILLPMAVLMIVTSTHRMQRVLSFLYPSRDPLGSGYQVNAAIDTITGGGLWGLGIGNGIRKIGSVPEIYSDFIFVVVAEETGFIGVCLYLALLLCFSFVGLIIALRSNNRFGCFVAFGATMAITVQSLLNLAVIVRLVPATGIPLPFFSFGGTSLLITLSLAGLIVNVSSYGSSSAEKRSVYA